MDFDSSDNSDAHFADKIKMQTFKEFQLERLIKEGKVMPASQLEATKAEELRRIREFETASEDEQRHQSAAAPPPKNKLKNLPLTRVRDEE